MYESILNRLVFFFVFELRFVCFCCLRECRVKFARWQANVFRISVSKVDAVMKHAGNKIVLFNVRSFCVLNVN